MEPTTVEVTDRFGDHIIYLNCGSITQAGSTVIVINDQTLIINQILPDPVGAAQRFADLLTDVTA